MITDEFRKYVVTKLANAEYRKHKRIDFEYHSLEQCNYVCEQMRRYNFTIIWDFRNSHHLVGTFYTSMC